MTADNLVKLSEEDINDLLYDARAGNTDDLLAGIDRLKRQTKYTEKEVLLAVADEHSGNTVLHMAAANGHIKTISEILLLLHGQFTPGSSPHPLVSHKNRAGNTALHWASLNGHLPVVKILVIEANADPSLPNGVGHDSIYEAELNDKKDIVDWLLGYCENVEDGISDNSSQEMQSNSLKGSNSVKDIKSITL